MGHLKQFATDLNLDDLVDIFQSEILTIPKNKYGVVGKPSSRLSSPGWKSVDMAIISSSAEILDIKTYEYLEPQDPILHMKKSFNRDYKDFPFVFLEKATIWFFKNIKNQNSEQVLRQLFISNYYAMLMNSIDFSKLPVS